jgi:hypothetical protein
MKLGTELRFAFYIAALSFIWLMLEYAVGLHDVYIEYQPVVSMLAVVIPVGFLFLGMRRKRDVDHDGVASWRQLFKTGMIITVFTALMLLPLQLVFHYFINPRFFDAMIQQAADRALANNRDPAQAQAEAAAYFNIKSYLLQSAIGILLFGTLLSVIYSFVLRRKEPVGDVAVPEFMPKTPAP